MVLLVKNTLLSSAPDDLAKFYCTYPHLLLEAKRIASKIPIKVDTRGVLYVRQKQWAATHPGELLDDGQVRGFIELLTWLEQPKLTWKLLSRCSNSFQEVTACGTEDVLTCHVIILRDPSTGVTAIAHFDEFSRFWDFQGMVEDFLNKIVMVKHKAEWEYHEDEGDEDWEWWDEEVDGINVSNNNVIDQLDPGDINRFGGVHWFWIDDSLEYIDYK